MTTSYHHSVIRLAVGTTCNLSKYRGDERGAACQFDVVRVVSRRPKILPPLAGIYHVAYLDDNDTIIIIKDIKLFDCGSCRIFICSRLDGHKHCSSFSLKLWHGRCTTKPSRAVQGQAYYSYILFKNLKWCFSRIIFTLTCISNVSSNVNAFSLRRSVNRQFSGGIYSTMQSNIA